MGDPLGFESALPKGFTLPPGYELSGMAGMDPGPAVYHWTLMPDERDHTTWRFGPNVLDKRKAVRQAWRDYRSGGADPSAVEPAE